MNLGDVIAKWRWANKITVRQAAKLIGLTSPSTICRLESGEQISGENLAILLRWLLEAR